MKMTRKQHAEEGLLTEEELKDEETKYQKMREEMREKSIIRGGKSILQDIIDGCGGEDLSKRSVAHIRWLPPEFIKEGKHNLCDCVTDSLNYMIPKLPKGEKTQTRRTFKETVKVFNKKKDKKELTGCTKSLMGI